MFVEEKKIKTNPQSIFSRWNFPGFGSEKKENHERIETSKKPQNRYARRKDFQQKKHDSEASRDQCYIFLLKSMDAIYVARPREQGEGPLYDWPPIWLDWIWPNKKIGCKLDALKLLNSNQSNWRPSIQWESSYGDFLWPCGTICNVPKCLKSRIIFCQFQLKVYILVLTEILCAQICFITVQFGRRTMFQFLIRVSHQTQNLQTPSSKFRNKSLPSMPTNRIFQRWGFASPRIVCLGLIHLLPRAPAKKHPFSTFLTLGHHHFEKGKGLMEYSI